uniref:Ubiquitin carboxyl-terminal hydrolase n=1 Tax=Albugo laibachii Nc14 TaxID=890382 RepID=F0W212_9STRA|nr:ubiquitin carboxylterminal hydrolase putative [Albugo laibachii Nc14]|eukprot:CCA15091.1 ubiquitin carboxylterminal hydrolase putative [Albugo laibachii Nc14]
MSTNDKDSVTVTVKWGKKIFENVSIDKNAAISDLQVNIHKLTSVPIARQKLMSKAWKGILKEDPQRNQLSGLQNGSTLMLMGSAEVVTKPKEATIFLEDLTSKDIADLGVVYPAGLKNLGNTCFMNATMQCLRPVKEFRDALEQHSTSTTQDLEQNVTMATQRLYKELEGSLESLTPSLFVNVLRQAYPQFAQMMPRGGGYMQQDSEEFLSTLLSTLSRTLVKPVGLSSIAPAKNVVQALFGLELNETLTCLESETEPKIEKKEEALKLVCNITIKTNLVAEGIKIGLEGVIEKHSDVLGRNAQWKKEIRVNRLPKYLCVQFMRFFWKLTPDSQDHTGVKCKMLRPISFPQILDVYEFCSDELQATLRVAREKNADKILNEFREHDEKSGQEGKAGEDMDMEDAEALEIAKSMSLGMKPSGIGLPIDFQGNYELFAILTHKGRSADSGHYMAWVHHEGDNWFCYDDEDVSPCKTEDIQKLKGGGDWHTAYLAFYRARN